MIWSDVKKNDVIHWNVNHASSGRETYVVVHDPIMCSGNHIRFKLLCLDNGWLYDDFRIATDVVPTDLVRIDRVEGV